MRILTVILCSIFLSACSNISLSDLATVGGATAGAALGALTGNPAVVISTTAAGGTAGSLVINEEIDTAEACTSNPEICTTITTGNVIQEFIHWGIGGIVLLIIVAWILPSPQSILFWRRKGKGEE